MADQHPDGPAAPSSTGGTAVAVAAHGISKRFGGTLALDDVTVELRVGEVHAFVGENGAGKSTLGKIVAGIYLPDSGRVEVDGTPVDRWDPGTAQASGVAMVAQELALVPDLTVAKNVFLGIEDHVGGMLRANLAERFAALEEQVQFGLDPHAFVGDLSIAQQQKVEIMRALARDARVIVMDEPTSSLSSHEAALLHSLIARLCEQGRSIVYVSHFLDAVMQVSDRVTVLRDGQHILTGDVQDMTKDDVVEAMLGRSLEAVYPERASIMQDLDPVLDVRGLSTHTGVEEASLHVGAGEIVGLLGLVGSGRSEIARAIFGADKRSGGTVRLCGRDLPERWGVNDAIAAGVAMVPESRHHEGLLLDRSVRENVALAALPSVSSRGIVRRAREREIVTRSMEDLEMRPLRIDLSVAGFSGGNQQKALLGKWMINEPSLIILDEPTRGVDVGAKRTIYRAIADMAAQGMAVLLISSEHEEVLGLAHRAYMISQGRTVEEIDPTSVTADEVVRALFTIEDEDPPA